MTMLRKIWVYSAVLLCLTSVTSLRAHAIATKACFAIRVRLNGRLLDDPTTITFKTASNEKSVPSVEGCFEIPAFVHSEKAVDVFFTVPSNRIYISTIAPEFFAGPWDVELEDHHFGRDIALPKHARVTEVCGVVFHIGEPERAITQAPCRTPF